MSAATQCANCGKSIEMRRYYTYPATKTKRLWVHMADGSRIVAGTYCEKDMAEPAKEVTR